MSEREVLMPSFRSSNANHILAVSQSVGFVLGGCYNDRRWEKDTDGLSRVAKHIPVQVNSGNYNGAKGLVLSDCDLTAQDIKYLSTHLPAQSYNFTIIDFSNNPKIGTTGLDYLIRGHEGIEHSKLSTTPLTPEERAAMPTPMLFGKPFVLPQSFIDKAKEFEKTYVHDDHVYKGLATRSNIQIHKIDLSNCGIGDAGVDILKTAIQKGKLKVKNIDLSDNGISSSKIKELLDVSPQDLYILTEKNESTGEGKAIFKSTDGKLYDFKLKSDGKDCTVEFGDGITGISGVSAGDTCLPTVKDQIKACVGGAAVGSLVGLETCKGGIKQKLICYAEKTLAGCAYGVAGVVGTQCAVGKEYKEHDSGYGFSATGGTEIKGTSVDNDHGLVGSSFDLSQHDF